MTTQSTSEGGSAGIAVRLDLPPAEAAAYFASKVPHTSWDWTDARREQHVHGFTFARATALDVVGAVHAEMRRTFEEGMSFAEFARTLRPRLQDMGWWGRKEVLDAETGELSTVQLGSDRRLRTIFQTNVQTAYMAGRYMRLMDDVENRPYWQYVAVMDGRTRPAHAALHGKVFRWDDPIWKVIFPPNGWGCRCRVRALTQAEVEAMGLRVDATGADSIRTEPVRVNAEDTIDVEVVDYVDPITGRTRTFRPDPGWDYNPGEAWSRFDPAEFTRDAIDAQPLTMSTSNVIRATDDARTWADAGRPDLLDSRVRQLPNPGVLDVARDSATATRAMVDALIPDGQLRVIATPVEAVAIRPELLPPAGENLMRSRARYARLAGVTLTRPFEVWLTRYDDGTYRKRYLARIEGNQLVVVRQNRDGALTWDVYDLLDYDAARLNALRSGNLLYADTLTDDKGA